MTFKMTAFSCFAAQSVLFSLLVALAAVFDPDDPPFLGVSKAHH
jgi:hypothetical protein